MMNHYILQDYPTGKGRTRVGRCYKHHGDSVGIAFRAVTSAVDARAIGRAAARPGFGNSESTGLSLWVPDD